MHSFLPFHTGVLPIGIDLGASGAKIAQLRRVGGRLALITALRVDAPADVRDPEESAQRILASVARRLPAAGFVGRRCILSAPSALVEVRSVRLPAMPDAEIEAALRLDGAERLGLPAESEIGWLRAGEIRHADEARDEILLMGAARDAIESLVADVAAAGLEPIAVEPSFVAAARALGRFYRRDSDRRRFRIMVDIGRRSAGVAILRGDALAFFKPLSWGGQRLDQVAAEALGLEPAAVAEVRRDRRRAANSTNAQPVDPAVDRAVYDAVRPILDELAHEITLCLRYSMVTFRGEKPECAVLVGGEADEPRLAELISHAIGVETMVARPFESIDISGARLIGLDRRSSMADWATATGLSMRAEQTAEHPLVRRVRAMFPKPALPRIARKDAA